MSIKKKLEELGYENVIESQNKDGSISIKGIGYFKLPNLPDDIFEKPLDGINEVKLPPSLPDHK